MTSFNKFIINTKTLRTSSSHSVTLFGGSGGIARTVVSNLPRRRQKTRQ